MTTIQATSQLGSQYTTDYSVISETAEGKTYTSLHAYPIRYTTAEDPNSSGVKFKYTDWLKGFKLQYAPFGASGWHMGYNDALTTGAVALNPLTNSSLKKTQATFGTYVSEQPQSSSSIFNIEPVSSGIKFTKKKFKVYIPAGTINFNLSCALPANNRFAVVCRLGSTPSRTKPLTSGEYTSNIRSSSSQWERIANNEEVIVAHDGSGAFVIAAKNTINSPRQTSIGQWLYVQVINGNSLVSDATKNLDPGEGAYIEMSALNYSYTVDKSTYRAVYNSLTFGATGDPIGNGVKNSVINSVAPTGYTALSNSYSAASGSYYSLHQAEQRFKLTSGLFSPSNYGFKDQMNWSGIAGCHLGNSAFSNECDIASIRLEFPIISNGTAAAKFLIPWDGTTTQFTHTKFRVFIPANTTKFKLVARNTGAKWACAIGYGAEPSSSVITDADYALLATHVNGNTAMSRSSIGINYEWELLNSGSTVKRVATPKNTAGEWTIIEWDASVSNTIISGVGKWLYFSVINPTEFTNGIAATTTATGGCSCGGKCGGSGGCASKKSCSSSTTTAVTAPSQYSATLSNLSFLYHIPLAQYITHYNSLTFGTDGDPDSQSVTASTVINSSFAINSPSVSSISSTTTVSLDYNGVQGLCSVPFPSGVTNGTIKIVSNTSDALFVSMGLNQGAGELSTSAPLQTMVGNFFDALTAGNVVSTYNPSSVSINLASSCNPSTPAGSLYFNIRGGTDTKLLVNYTCDKALYDTWLNNTRLNDTTVNTTSAAPLPVGLGNELQSYPDYKLLVRGKDETNPPCNNNYKNFKDTCSPTALGNGKTISMFMLNVPIGPQIYEFPDNSPHEYFPPDKPARYRVFLPPGTTNFQSACIDFNHNGTVPTKLVLKLGEPPSTTPDEINEHTGIGLGGGPVKPTLTALLDGEEVKVYSPEGSGGCNFGNRITFNDTLVTMDTGKFVYINIYSAPLNVMRFWNLRVEIDPQIYAQWYANALWDSNGNPRDDVIHTVAGSQTVRGTSLAKPLTANVAATSVTQAVVESVQYSSSTTYIDGDIVKTYSIDPPLPNWLKFDTTTGVISGSGTGAAPTTSYTITVSDSMGNWSKKSFDLTIVDPLTVSDSTSSVTVTFGREVLPFAPLTVTGGSLPISWAIDNQLPEGITFNTSTGIISGAANQLVDITTAVVSATDAIGQSVKGDLTLFVQPLPLSMRSNGTVYSYQLGKVNSITTSVSLVISGRIDPRPSVLPLIDCYVDKKGRGTYWFGDVAPGVNPPVPGVFINSGGTAALVLDEIFWNQASTRPMPEYLNILEYFRGYNIVPGVTVTPAAEFLLNVPRSTIMEYALLADVVALDPYLLTSFINGAVTQSSVDTAVSKLLQWTEEWLLAIRAAGKVPVLVVQGIVQPGLEQYVDQYLEKQFRKFGSKWVQQRVVFPNSILEGSSEEGLFTNVDVGWLINRYPLNSWTGQ